MLEAQVTQIKDKLLNIINKKINSYYWDFSMEIYKEIGSRKVGTPMAIMGYFKILRVTILFFSSFYCFNYRIRILTFSNFNLDTMAQKD